jgi:multisubunit Na+/H+ antiporter MnhB subunit
MAEIGDNTQGAEASAAVDAYYARRRSVGFRSFLLLVSVAAVLVVLRLPILGFDLLLGGACGLGNMWLVMRNNERLLDGRRSRGVYGLVNVIRILGIGIVPVFSAVTGPWWSLGIALAGFFTPLALYSIALRQEYSTG